MSFIYSFAFLPPPEIAALVRKHKLFASRHFGWYPSVNSLAHITVSGFEAFSWELRALCTFAEAYCAKRTSFSVRFDHFNTYPNGTFFLAPDERSRSLLSPIMKDFNRKMPMAAMRTTDPHMTIARGLDMPDLTNAPKLFSNTTPELSFRIDGLSLRRFNEARRQYDTIAHFPFGSAFDSFDCFWQGCLFST